MMDVQSSTLEGLLIHIFSVLMENGGSDDLDGLDELIIENLIPSRICDITDSLEAVVQ